MGWPGRALAQYPEFGPSQDDRQFASAGCTDGDAIRPTNKNVTKKVTVLVIEFSPLKCFHQCSHGRTLSVRDLLVN